MLKIIKNEIKKILILYKVYSILKSIYYSVLLFPIRASINYRRFQKYYFNTQDELIKEAIPILGRHNRIMIPFNFTEKYWSRKYSQLYSNNYFPTIEVDGHKVYFPRKTSKKQVLEEVRNNFIEQDPESPHRYISDKWKIHGHTAVLIGASDGLFALEIINSFQHIFLFESDKEWIAPLKKTFEMYKEKITIVNSFVSDKIVDEQVTLDGFFENYKNPIDFLQADVEGNAYLLLKGAEKILTENSMKIALACYHTNSESTDLKTFLEKLGYGISFSNKFVFMWMQNLIEPYVRKGVIYGEKIK
jgi:hypothetical protein